jgi:hypothetical protein
LWANFMALIGIFSQSVGPSFGIWANPVHFSLSGEEEGGELRNPTAAPCGGHPPLFLTSEPPGGYCGGMHDGAASTQSQRATRAYAEYTAMAKKLELEMLGRPQGWSIHGARGL